MRISDWSSDVCSSDLLEHGLSLEVHPSGIGPLVQAKDRHMNKVFLAGRITSDVTRFGNDTKSGVSFTLVTSKPVIKDGPVQKDGKGYTETWDEIGRASCRERECPYEWISVVAGSLK